MTGKYQIGDKFRGKYVTSLRAEIVGPAMNYGTYNVYPVKFTDEKEPNDKPAYYAYSESALENWYIVIPGFTPGYYRRKGTHEVVRYMGDEGSVIYWYGEKWRNIIERVEVTSVKEQ